MLGGLPQQNEILGIIAAVKIQECRSDNNMTTEVAWARCNDAQKYPIVSDLYVLLGDFNARIGSRESAQDQWGASWSWNCE